MYQALDKIGTGEANEGFLRSDAILAVIMVSDEDDCSGPEGSWIYDVRPYNNPNAKIADLAQSGGGFSPNPYRNSYPTASTMGSGVDANEQDMIQFEQICQIAGQASTISGQLPLLNAPALFSNQLLSLKGSNPDLVLFAAIIGAPYDGDFANPSNLLNDSAMQYADSCNADKQSFLVPACLNPDVGQPSEGSNTRAIPARRVVQAAQAFTSSGIDTQLSTICNDDFSDAITDIAAAIGSKVGGACLPRPISRNSQDLVNCRVIETEPLNVTCASVGNGRDPTPIAVEGGREVCTIEQLPSTGGVPPGVGWYYDDSGAAATACPIPGVDNSHQRVAFTVGAEATDGSEVRFECFQPVAPDGVTEPTDRGSPCTSTSDCSFMGENAQTQADRLQEIYNQPDLSLMCDTFLSLTCQIACDNDAGCPGGFVCYDRDVPATEDGDEFCIIPTCTVGLIDQ
jgi:hypothetical protein